MHTHLNAISHYIITITRRYKTGISRELSYRGDLQHLLQTITPDVLVTNEPARVACGAPDYILTRNNIPVGYIEAKDIGKPLDSTDYKEQFDRYRTSLDNLIITDYLDFHFYRDGSFTTSINIADVQNGKIKPRPDNFETFLNLFTDFITFDGQTITSSLKLARMMAGKARLLSQVLYNAVSSDEQSEADSSLKAQFKAFQDVLIHDLQPKAFADIYAQTIAYGMFAARLHDPSLDDFSRQEAAQLIPKSNPFLRKLFQYIAGYDLDDRITWIVDALADIFRATDVNALLANFGKTTQKNDPIIHFYEEFLAAFDPKQRKSRGVYYTPEPVVNFIVRAIDHILKEDFDLPQGLADTSTTTIAVDTTVPDKRSKTGFKREKKSVHKVQFLDPATGTATFLAELIKQIYAKFDGQQGIWSNYVENHLLPRVHGFEILMASYAMAHLKLEMLLRETGYKPQKEQRFKVYLTNALEEHHPDTGTLFANWLSTEASEADYIKRDTPIMVVYGNPPYSGHSANKGKWIENLLDDYKQEPGGGKLQEKNPKWLNDDYVKFIRYGQHFIEKNGEGILAFINNHSFIDNPTFRGMRWHLLKTFDKIYIADLHGNAKKKETCADGSPDTNVFDIMQGVSINIFIKTGKKKENDLGHVLHYDLFGKREYKYDYLWNHDLNSIRFDELELKTPNYFFIKQNYKLKKQYEEGFSIKELFLKDSMGITSGKDKELISFTSDELQEKENPDKFIEKISYRPFDQRYIYYDPNLLARARFQFMRHLKSGENLAIALIRRSRDTRFVGPLITRGLIDKCIISTLDNANIFPLYLYPETKDAQISNEIDQRIPNFNKEILNNFRLRIGLKFSNEFTDNTLFSPIDLLSYIYLVLFSNSYINQYFEFLSKDFPRIPYPKDANTFWQLVELGAQLRQIHLLESPIVEQFITTYPQDGDNIITRRMGKKDFEIRDTDNNTGRVWINERQYFDKVPEIAWNFYIGGYQPAQKWLKDRKGRPLSFEDIRHYQKIIVALTETDRIMKEIDLIPFMD